MSHDKDGLLAKAQALLPQTIDLRRRIHRHPELGNNLPQTKAAVMSALDGLDLEIEESPSTSGVVATLAGGEGPTILLRGDMDALPMPEDTGLEFASTIDGRMHACGHDAHTAMLASAARLLCDLRDDLPGRVKFMFQPGEEGPGGAMPMIEEGLIEADAAFALHISPNTQAGLVSCRPGNMLAAADRLFVRLWGQGGHGSMPHDANDPVPVLCEIVQAIQTFVTRKIAAFDPAVVTVGRIAAGSTNNVIPESGVLEATMRSYSPESREKLHKGLHRLIESIAAAHDMRVDIDLDKGYPATINHAEFVRFVENTVTGQFGAERYQDMPQPLMAAEDFSYVLHRMPGAMAMIGVAPDGIDPATGPACHSNRMILNEDAMAVGVATHAAVAMNYLQNNGNLS